MNYVADFETFVPSDEVIARTDRAKYPRSYVDPKDIETYVWAWAMVEVGKTAEKDIKIGNNIASFMQYAFTKRNPTIYFHNLKFDGMFIMDWLLNNGYTHSDEKLPMTFNTIISEMNMFYQIEVIKEVKHKYYKKVVFLDSLKKLPFSVDRIGKAFGLDYGKIDVEEEFYKRYRSKDHKITAEEKEYLMNDVRVMSQALQIQFNQGLTKMTVGSDSLQEYKDIVGKQLFERQFPVLDLDLNEQIRLAYRGGFTYASDNFKEKEIGEGSVYDVNSLYPSIMRYKPMPYGIPFRFEGKYKENDNFPLYIQELRCDFKLKKDHIPTIQIKEQIGRFKPNEYLTESKGIVKLHLTNVDLELFLEHYDVWDIEYTCGLMFMAKTGMFSNYIDKWSIIKESSKGAIRELAKLMLNSLYGKFATNPEMTDKSVVLKEGIVKLLLNESEMKEPVYTAVGVWTTAYGRYETISTAQKNYDRFIYADTDSVHLVGLEEPDLDIHPTRMGAWDHESNFTWGKFIGAKCYAEEIGGKLKVVVAGMTEYQRQFVTKENFKVGLELDGKRMPMIVKGGVVLVNRTYELKVRSYGRF